MSIKLLLVLFDCINRNKYFESGKLVYNPFYSLSCKQALWGGGWGRERTTRELVRRLPVLRYFVRIRCGVMVSAMDSGLSGPGWSAGRHRCAVFLGKTVPLFMITQEYKWLLANNLVPRVSLLPAKSIRKETLSSLTLLAERRETLGTRLTGKLLGQHDKMLGVTCDGLASHPGGVAILQLWRCMPVGPSAESTYLALFYVFHHRTLT